MIFYLFLCCSRATAPSRAFSSFALIFFFHSDNAPALSALRPRRWLPGSPVPAGDGRHFRLSW